MPRTMFTDELWLKLKSILLDLNIHDKPNLRNTIPDAQRLHMATPLILLFLMVSLMMSQ